MEPNHILGNIPVIRTIAYFVRNPGMDHTKGEIRDATGIKQADMLRDLPNLLEHDVIIETRRIRGEPLYMLNQDNRVTQAIITFSKVIADAGTASEVLLCDELPGDAPTDPYLPEYPLLEVPEQDIEPPEIDHSAGPGPENMLDEPESVVPTGEL